MRSWLPAAVVFLASCSLGFGSSRKQREQGAALFASSGCQHCHSIAGVGGHRGPDLSNVGRIKSKTAIRHQIINGSAVMPSFRDVLAPAEIDDLVAYLHSCRSKQHPEAPSVPSQQQAQR
jgi:mono/diheme cytochrome c family protein